MYVAGRAFNYRTPDGDIVSVSRGGEVMGFESWTTLNRTTCLRTGYVLKVADAPATVQRAPEVPLVSTAPDCWPCPDCEGKTFKNATGLAVHRKRIHGI